MESALDISSFEISLFEDRKTRGTKNTVKKNRKEEVSWHN